MVLTPHPIAPLRMIGGGVEFRWLTVNEKESPPKRTSSRVVACEQGSIGYGHGEFCVANCADTYGPSHFGLVV